MELSITGMSFRTTVDDIYRAFSFFGQLKDCRIIINERLESKGFGFVCYNKREEAENAIKFMNGYNLDGHKIIVQDSKSALKENVSSSSESENRRQTQITGYNKADYDYIGRRNSRKDDMSPPERMRNIPYNDIRNDYDDRYQEQMYDRRSEFSRNSYDNRRNHNDRRRYNDRRMMDSNPGFNRDYTY